MRILWICFVWPEPNSSAAGLRTLQLLQACKGDGHEVRVFSSCQENAHQLKLEELGFETKRVAPNDPQFDSALLAYQPDLVVFDRFMTEEQFSWRVREHCPAAVRVLDTIDLHSLRRARQKKVESGRDPQNLSNADLSAPDALREISAIFRSDLSLVVSDFELNLLREHYRVPGELLSLCRLSYPGSVAITPFERRKHFVSIGNFNHPPNLDSFRWLHRTVWPKIRAALAELGQRDIELHIYGAYPSKEIMGLDDAATGFRVKGWTANALETLAQYRVNLAPLRFGAGLKGKISDGWAVGAPCIATSIAAEGMHTGLEFGGFVEDECQQFAAKAAELYSDCRLWGQAQQRGLEIIKDLFNPEQNVSLFLESLRKVFLNREARRQSNIVGAMLWYHQLRSTEFMSRWIETKNKLGEKRVF